MARYHGKSLFTVAGSHFNEVQLWRAALVLDNSSGAVRQRACFGHAGSIIYGSNLRLVGWVFFLRGSLCAAVCA